MKNKPEMSNQVFDIIKKRYPLSPEKQQQMTDAVVIAKLSKRRQLVLKEGDIVFVERGLIKKVNQANESPIHFIGQGDFLLIPTSAEKRIFLTVEDSELIIMTEADFLSIAVGAPQLLEAHALLSRYWAFRQLIRNNLLELEAAEAKEQFPKHFKGIAHRLTNSEIAGYLNINKSYYSSL